jgi:uncharacterized Zn finger protein (UPF0148 family)
MEAGKSRPTNDESFELKYCERCGGLWLRPVSSGQIYCVACSREMAQLPPSSSEPERERVPRKQRSQVDDSACAGYRTDMINLEPLGGLA